MNLHDEPQGAEPAREIHPCRPTERWTQEIVPYLRWLCARTPEECALVALGMQEVDRWA